jgi:hypothetical protein
MKTEQEFHDEESKTPNLDKWAAIEKEYNAIDDFLEYLEFVGFELAKYSHTQHGYVPSLVSRERLLAGYFNLDLDKIEAERKMLLE